MAGNMTPQTGRAPGKAVTTVLHMGGLN
jgi:hypothetical protein